MKNKLPREGTHYSPRDKKENKEKYTIAEITVQSTGISKDDDILYPAARTWVGRIVNRIIDFTGEERLKSDIKFKQKVIQIVKKAYFSKYSVENLTSMLNNKLEVKRLGDSGGEDEVWSILAIIESIIDMPTDYPSTFQRESQEFKDIVGKILEKVQEDMLCLSVLVWDNDKKKVTIQ